MDNFEMENTVKSCLLFKNLSHADIRDIIRLCEVRSYKAGDHIFQQGEMGEHLHIIVKGQATLERSIDLRTRKGKVAIETLGKGRVLGCWSTILGEPHMLMSTAVCDQPTQVVSFKGTALRDMMMSNSSLGFNVLEGFCFLLKDRIQAAYGALEKI